MVVLLILKERLHNLFMTVLHIKGSLFFVLRHWRKPISPDYGSQVVDFLLVDNPRLFPIRKRRLEKVANIRCLPF